MKTVLITGASRGIGREAALHFAKSGYNVAINYKESKALAEELKSEIINMGSMAEIFCADVKDFCQVQKMTESVIEKFGDIHVLVNNAGVALPQGLFTEFDEAAVKSVFETNVFGTMNCSKAVIPHFVHKKCGKIINVSSIWGLVGGSCEVIYSASKGAIVAFTKALAKELAPSGICVNCVAPGLIETDMNKHLSDADKGAFKEEIPLGRLGLPDDVANTILFLASDEASYITGQVMTVDGGYV